MALPSGRIVVQAPAFRADRVRLVCHVGAGAAAHRAQRQHTEAELLQAGSHAAYGLIPADSFGTTVRRTVDRRLFLRNVYSYATDFRTTERDVAKARRHQQVAFERRWPGLAPIGFEASWGGLLTLAQNGGMVFGELARGVYGAAFCNGTGVARGAAFGKAVAELAVGRTSRTIEILKSRAVAEPGLSLAHYVARCTHRDRAAVPAGRRGSLRRRRA